MNFCAKDANSLEANLLSVGSIKEFILHVGQENTVKKTEVAVPSIHLTKRACSCRYIHFTQQGTADPLSSSQHRCLENIQLLVPPRLTGPESATHEMKRH